MVFKYLWGYLDEQTTHKGLVFRFCFFFVCAMLKTYYVDKFLELVMNLLTKLTYRIHGMVWKTI